MGVLDKFLGVGLGGVIGPAGQALMAKEYAGTSAGAWFDPMDLLGFRADATQDEIARLQNMALSEQEVAQRDAYLQSLAQQKPYYDAGVNALEQLNTPGVIPPSQQYLADLEQGNRALNRSLAASGQFRSSNAYDTLGRFQNQLSGQEAGRRYNNALAPIKIAQDAMGSMGRASDTYGAGMANAYGNYGNQSAQNALAYGQSRADAYRTAGNSINQAAQYYGSR